MLNPKKLFQIFKIGKLAENETIEQCAEREVFEECSLVVRNLEKIGILVYEFIDSNILMEVHFFHTSDYTGRFFFVLF